MTVWFRWKPSNYFPAGFVRVNILLYNISNKVLVSIIRIDIHLNAYWLRITMCWNLYRIFENSGGAGGTRTPYLRLAKAALSQMSYSPQSE